MTRLKLTAHCLLILGMTEPRAWLYLQGSNHLHSNTDALADTNGTWLLWLSFESDATFAVFLESLQLQSLLVAQQNTFYSIFPI